MLRTSATLLAPLLCALSLGSFADPAPAPGPGAIIDLHVRIFRALDTVDPAALRDELALGDDFVVYGPGPNGPVRAQGEAEVWNWFKDAFEATKAAGGTFSTKITWSHADCHSPELGYGLIEFTRTQVKDGVTTEAHFRATALASWDKGHCRLRHWHLTSIPHEPRAVPSKGG